MTTTAPNPTSTDSAGVTVGELAAALGMSRSAILRAVESGRFPRPMDERRHGWRVWHPAVALALEVAHEFDRFSVSWAEDLAETLRSSAMASAPSAQDVIESLARSDLNCLRDPLRRRVDALRAKVPS